MVFVAVDSNVPDETVQMLDAEPELTEGMEALSPPPAGLSSSEYAWYWLIALAPYWHSCLWTFSDALYYEVSRIPPAKQPLRLRLLSVAAEIREAHPRHARVPDPSSTPTSTQMSELGLQRMDARHVADAVGLGCSHLLTRDRDMLKRADAICSRYGLNVTTPEEFLIAAVRAGAPWPTRVPWPWESGPLSTEGDIEST